MQNGRLTIRRASSADAQSIAFVHVISWREAYMGLIPDQVLAGLSIEERTSRWQAILAGKTGTRSREYLAEVDGNVVGFGSCGPQRDPDLVRQAFTGEVLALYVLRSAQRRGVGTSLMSAMAGHLRQEGYDAYGLWVLHGNRAAREFYERLGGAVVGEKIDARDYGNLHEVAYGWRLSGDNLKVRNPPIPDVYMVPSSLASP
jgi:ribosomal protein S18 acetylase RimI-like enzyme